MEHNRMLMKTWNVYCGEDDMAYDKNSECQEELKNKLDSH